VTFQLWSDTAVEVATAARERRRMAKGEKYILSYENVV
jgi:hypothetical protein